MRFVLSLFLCGLVAACARPSGEGAVTPKPSPQKPMPSPAPIQKPTPTPQTPEEFYRQFLFQLVGACGSRAFNYRFVDSEPTVIAVNKSGQDVMAELSLLMYPDHTYKAFYGEIDIISYSPGGYYWLENRFKSIAGLWRVRNDRLELSGLGFAVPGPNTTQPTMLFTSNSDLITGGLKTQTLVMRNIVTDYVPVREVDPCRDSNNGGRR